MEIWGSEGGRVGADVYIRTSCRLPCSRRERERERRAGKWEKQIKSSPSCRPFEDTTKINDIISVARIRSLAQKTKSSVSREGGRQLIWHDASLHWGDNEIRLILIEMACICTYVCNLFFSILTCSPFVFPPREGGRWIFITSVSTNGCV